MSKRASTSTAVTPGRRANTEVPKSTSRRPSRSVTAFSLPDLMAQRTIIDPDGYVENQVGLVKGLAHGVTHPVEFAKAVVDWDTWVESPGRALGHLLPTIALARATAGAGAAGKGHQSRQ